MERINASQKTDTNPVLADPNIRIRARLIDEILLSVITIPLGLWALMASIMIHRGPGKSFPQYYDFIIPLIIYLIFFFYFIFSYYILNGKTLGKIIMKVQIIKVGNKRIPFQTCLIRSALDALDTMFLCHIIGCLFLEHTKNRQTLSDKVAGTLVISTKNKKYSNAPSSDITDIIDIID